MSLDGAKTCRIGVVVPVYNRPSLVAQALESIAAQTLPPSRLVVVDDGSTDDTAASIRSWLERQRLPFEAKLLRQENRGAGAARNLGTDQARDCDLLAFLDSDDLWPTDYLQRMVDAMTAHPQSVAATCDQVHLEYQTGREQRKQVARCDIPENLTQYLVENGPVGTANTVFRASHFFAIGGYDPQYRTGQDYELMLRISLRGPWLYVPGEAVTYRHEIGRIVGESPALSHTLDNRPIIRARLLDEFIHHHGGRQAVPDPVWRRRLVRSWSRAGRRMLRSGRLIEAAQCFSRALRLQPWKTWGAH